MKDKIIQRAKTLHDRKIVEVQKKSNAIRNKLLLIPEVNNAYIAYMKIINESIQNKKDPYRPSMNAYHEYLNVLSKYGYDDSFGYKPICPKCNDEGIVNGKFCDCFYNEYLDALKDVCEIDKKAPFSFEDARFEIIENEQQRENLKKLYDLMKKFVEKYPNTSKFNITLTGGVGTGKTSLSSAIARAAAEKGQTVKIMSAYEFNAYMISCHTSPIENRAYMMSDILTADYLIIDDLGTEPLTKNVTVEYLLLVLNERTISKKATIITTNLTIDGISQKYGERIYSRLSDKANSLTFHLSGKDLRRK